MPWILALSTLGLSSCDNTPDYPRDTTIAIDAHNCHPSCQSFGVTIKPDGATTISVFRTYYDGREWRSNYQEMFRKQSSPAAYEKIRNAIAELDVEDIEQSGTKNYMRCVNVRGPLLTVRSETQLDTHYYLYLSCAEHREAALRLGNLAKELAEDTVKLDDWPLDKSRHP